VCVCVCAHKCGKQQKGVCEYLSFLLWFQLVGYHTSPATSTAGIGYSTCCRGSLRREPHSGSHGSVYNRGQNSQNTYSPLHDLNRKYSGPSLRPWVFYGQVTWPGKSPGPTHVPCCHGPISLSTIPKHQFTSKHSLTPTRWRNDKESVHVVRMF
jgi:hypothetical protein